jgi:carbonic anhydrase
VIVCGHYGCSGVRAAYENQKIGLIDNWLRHVQDVRDDHQPLLTRAGSPDAALDRLCELNVLEQARHVCETTIVQDAWARGQALSVHGVIYGIHDGRMRDLGFSAASDAESDAAFTRALAALSA